MKEPEWKAPKRDGKAFFDRRFIAPASAIDAEAIRQQFHVVIRKPAVRQDGVIHHAQHVHAAPSRLGVVPRATFDARCLLYAAPSHLLCPNSG
jgi:hypothetical protein